MSEIVLMIRHIECLCLR